MEELFLKLVNMSITASYLVLAVIAFRILLKKAPKYLRVALWGLVGLRLVFPFSVESVLSLIPSAEPLPEEFLYAATPQINTGIPAVNNAVNPVIAQSLAPAELTSANPTQIWSFILSRVWLIGLGLMLLYAAVSFFLVRRKIGPSIPVEKNVRLCDHLSTPFILGIVRPKIYLPSSLDEETTWHVLAHEQAHLARKDHWWKPLGYLLLCVYWFNPVMWVAYILLCRDIEMACDEKVIKELDADRKKAYSAALLQCSIPRRMIAACPLAFGEVGVKNRIKSVLNYKKPAFWIIVVAVIASVAVAVCFLTDPAGQSVSSYIGVDWSTVESISVDSNDDNYAIMSQSGMESVQNLLEGTRISRNEISLNRSEDRDNTHTITLNFEKTSYKICFNADLTEVWFNDGVKPSLSYQVMDPEPVARFFASADEAPLNRLTPGEYIAAEVVYWPLYSSALRPEYPQKHYQVTEDQFYFESEGERFTVDWGWSTLAQYAEELQFYFEWYDLMEGFQGIPPCTDTSLYQKIDDKHHLFLIDDAIYLVEGYETSNAMTHVGVIYRLEKYEITESSYAMEIVDSAHYTNGVFLTVDFTYPEEIYPSPQEVVLTYTSENGEVQHRANSITSVSVDAESRTRRFQFLFNLKDEAPVDRNFTLSVGDFRLNPGEEFDSGLTEPLTVSYEADVGPANCYSYKADTAHASLIVSPLVLQAEVFRTEIDTIDELYQAIKLLDKDGGEIPVQGISGGSSGGGNHITLYILLTQPIDLDEIETVMIGDMILE